MARYENDDYHRVTREVPGNPWFICTLWLAEYLIEQEGDEGAIDQALEILSWVSSHALPSGVLSEQINPLTGEALSVSPLTWSHATYIAAIHSILRRLARKPVPLEPGMTFSPYIREEDWIFRLYNQTCDAIHGICKF